MKIGVQLFLSVFHDALVPLFGFEAVRNHFETAVVTLRTFPDFLILRIGPQGLIHNEGLISQLVAKRSRCSEILHVIRYFTTWPLVAGDYFVEINVFVEFYVGAGSLVGLGQIYRVFDCLLNRQILRFLLIIPVSVRRIQIEFGRRVCYPPLKALLVAHDVNYLALPDSLVVHVD